MISDRLDKRYITAFGIPAVSRTNPTGSQEHSADNTDGREGLTSIAVLNVCTLTLADSYRPYVFISSTLPVLPLIPQE